MDSHPLSSLPHHSYTCGMNYRLSCNCRESVNCAVRVYASNQRSKCNAVSLTARIHGSGKQDVEVEEVLLTLIPNNALKEFLIHVSIILGLVVLEVLVPKGRLPLRGYQSWFH